MKKRFVSRSEHSKKQRGIAVIFTLGILGLLTVIALGFASTALLNNSLSKNAMNISYARSLAKNLALTQAIYIINQKETDSNGGFVDFRNIYTWGTDANSANYKDFLWKLDYSDAGVQMFTYEPDKTANNPANNVRWQYVKDSNNKLIGRYAYVVIPDKGRIDPSVNVGKDDDLDSTSIKNLENRIPPGISVGDLADAYTNKFRWMTYREIIKKASISDAFYTFEYDGISPSLTMKSPEAYRENNVLYSRFNMNRTDWNSMTAETLCGAALTSGASPEIFPTKQTFIPWLKKMYDNPSTQTQALQIAANIIQYNRSADQPTVTDKSADADWLTVTDTPAYAGIGRHPMLNEIGFLIRVRTDVETEPQSASDEDHIKVTYKPVYYIAIDMGAELVYPFGSATGLKDSEIKFSGVKDDSHTYTWKYPDSPEGSSKDTTLTSEQKKITNMLVRFQLKKFLTDGKTPAPQTKTNELVAAGTFIQGGILNAEMVHGDLDDIVIETTGKYGKVIDSSTVISQEGGGSWMNFDLSLLSADAPWNTSTGYTKSGSFWKGRGQRILKIPIRSITIETPVSLGTKETIAQAMARRMTINFLNFALGNVVLKYGTTPVQRDFAKLTNNITFSVTDMSTEKVIFLGYEAGDPMVNHSQGNWKTLTPTQKEWAVGYSGYHGSPGVINSNVNDADTAIKSLWTSYGWTEGKDPVTYSTDYRMPTSILRHGQMLSFWELGCISRGEAWKTLNLQKKDGSASPDFSYDKGDAVLFDQLKFTDDDYSAGKINLNANVHKVFEQLFLSVGTAGKELTFKKDIHKSSGDDLLSAGTDSTSSVKIYQSTLARYKAGKLHSSDDEPESGCLACQLGNIIKKPYLFQNRADLLSSNLPTVTACTNPTDAERSAMQNLLLSGNTYLEKIQLVSKLMPVLRATTVDTLRVVILAQSIREIGKGVPALVDWDGKGFHTAVPTTEGTDKKKAMYKAGYRRTIEGAAISNSGEPSTLSKTITTSANDGTYDLGADKITGETRLVATLVRDPVKRKWKLVRLQYVE